MIRGILYIRWSLWSLVLAILSLMAGCGGSSGGGLVSADVPEVRLQSNTLRLPVNTNGVLDANHMTIINAFVTRPDGQALPNGTSVQFTISGGQTGVGALYTMEYLDNNGDNLPDAFWNYPESSGGGQASIRFASFGEVGTATISASVTDPATGRVGQASLEIEVYAVEGSVPEEPAALTFTGSYVDALANRQSSLPLGAEDTLDQGAYSRLISVVVKDRLGNPVSNYPVSFGLIDSPITNYPATAGRFVHQGTDGDPEEGGDNFEAQSATFFNQLAPGVDRLFLHPDEQGNNRGLIGAYFVGLVHGDDLIEVQDRFPNNDATGSLLDTGTNVPWTVGRAQYGTITSLALTDSAGVASVYLTYPISRIMQTAILVAQAGNTSAVLNTGGALYLPSGTGRLSSSHSLLYPDSTTDVMLCYYDLNEIPIAGHRLIHNNANGNGITVNNNQAVVTSANGCVTFPISHDSDTATGNTEFKLSFSAGNGDNETVEITVQASSAQADFAGSLYCVLRDKNLDVLTGGTANIDVLILDKNSNPAPSGTTVFAKDVTQHSGQTFESIIFSPNVIVTGSDGRATTQATIQLVTPRQSSCQTTDAQGNTINGVQDFRNASTAEFQFTSPLTSTGCSIDIGIPQYASTCQ